MSAVVKTIAGAGKARAAPGAVETICAIAGFILIFGPSPIPAASNDVASHIAGDDWVYVDHGLAGTRYSTLKQITTKNVSQLVKACEYAFPEKEPSQTAPIVSAGRMYLTTAHHTVAIDAFDCRVIWSSTWTPREHEPTNTHRGAALADGKIIRGQEIKTRIELVAPLKP
jgi:alcohol dehydrogenase (cytochrome c)